MWKKEGVGLIVFNPNRHILTQKEFRESSRVGRQPGMRGFALETMKPGETVPIALIRMLGEELPGISVKWPPELIGEYPIFGKISADIYLTTTSSLDKLPVQVDEDPEVGDYRWEPIRQALGTWLRPGVRDVLAALLLKQCETATPQRELLRNLASG